MRCAGTRAGMGYMVTSEVINLAKHKAVEL